VKLDLKHWMKYVGNIPNAAGGLLGAAATESQRMPLGASLVICHDREFILALFFLPK
jgi:hypothetical protein